MTGLRTLGSAALVVGAFAGLAGLTGCGNQPGDLGALREDTPPAPLVQTVPAGATEVTPGKPPAEIAQIPDAETKDKPADAKSAPAELVSLNPENLQDVNTAKVAPAPRAETKADDSAPPAETVATPPPAQPAGEAVKPAPAATAADASAPATPAPAAAPATPADANVAAAPAAPATPADAGNTNTKAIPGDKAAGQTLADGDAPKPAPAPAPATPPAEETPQQKAARLLSEAERLGGVRNQANLQEADAAYQAGLKLFNDLEYEQAKGYFERAVSLDPANEAARQKLQVVNSLLGIHADRIATKVRELEQSARVKQQEALVQLANDMQEGRVLEERGTVLPNDITGVDRERILADQLDNLRKAQDRFRRVREILNWMPPSFDLPAERGAVDASLARLKQKIVQKDDEISYLRRVEAQREADSQRVRETELFKTRIAKLLEQVKDLYERGDYKGCERLAIRVLQIDPFNAEAESWKSKARGAYHSHERASELEDTREALKREVEDTDQETIGYAPIILYPSNWDQITRRVDNMALGKSTKEETWKADLIKKLQKKVTFDFVDTPLDEAVAFLRQISGVTIIVDPKVTAAGAAPNINLRVTDMSMDLALEWILRLANLDDLTQSIPDFPGPELQLETQGAQGGGQANPAANAFAPKTTVTPTAASIADMIKTRIRPDSWDQALGTSVEEMAGRLVVMQRPEIHALIDQLLASFRQTQRMMINIESRFLTIREANLENIGVEYQGLDTNVLFGDFGDITHLGAPNQFLQPRQPGAGDAIPVNAPFPGFVQGPTNSFGGSFSTVGSIVNHDIGYATNDPTTISSQDPNGIIRQGGLNTQLTIINNTQLQAFMRALAVRETTSTLVSPRLTVFNTQRAHMFVARQQSYIADYDINGDSYDPVIRNFLEGVVLDVRPIVSADRRYVTVEMRPTVTELISFKVRQIDSFTVNSGAQVNLIIPLSFPIQFPELAITRVRTTATVPDGGIMLLSGLFRNVKFNAENGLPFLSDLPVVGRMFRWNVKENAKQNLSILLSPRIILFSEEEEKL